QLRTALDQAGAAAKILVIAGDGSFCNRTAFSAQVERTELLVRARKDAKLCFAAAPGGHRIYGADKFTPEQVRQDEQRRCQTCKVFYAGKRPPLRYKEVPQVLCQHAPRPPPLPLFVPAPPAYRKLKRGPPYYRQPAYLLCSDLTSSAPQ